MSSQGTSVALKRGLAISDNSDDEKHLDALLAAQELPSWWRSSPSWLKGGFSKDMMAVSCEQVQHVPFLLSGRRPAGGQRIYAQLDYDHDGSHPETYRGWARMVGEVTKILPPPPAGLYNTYPGQEVELTEKELKFLRSQMPEMPPSFIHTSQCNCGFSHTVERVLATEGAVHGQALLGKIRLSCDDEGRLEPQLSGDWDVMFICNDLKENFWDVRAMKRRHGL